MPGFLSSVFGRIAGPTATEQAALAAAHRPATVHEAGGIPRPDTRLTSWWGGNFIAAPPRDGLVPLVQIRASELPPALQPLLRADYLLIWIEADPLKRTDQALGLDIQRLPAPDPASLAPVEVFCGLAGALARLPLTPARQHESTMMLPHPEDAPAPLPKVKRGPPPEDEEPVTIGGWPQWISRSQWPDGARFVMEIRSSKKGRFALPNDGSLYLFEGSGGWLVRRDGY